MDAKLDTSMRDVWLQADEAVLLRDCEVDTYRASGPGGQKRNKTSSAVRLRHRPSGLAVIAEESRSQHENKAKALRRLRAALALHVRRPWPTPLSGAIAPLQAALSDAVSADSRRPFSRKHENYWLVMALILDALETSSGEVKRAGGLIGSSTARVSALLTDDAKVMAQANAIRKRHGHKPISA